MMGTNQYSLLLVANLVTVDTLAIAVSWLRDDPQLFWQSVSPSQVGFLGLAVLWAAFFAILPSRPVRGHGLLPYFTGRPYSFLVKTIVIGSLLGCLAVSRIDRFPPVLRGYWSSTLIAFLKLDTPDVPTSGVPSKCPS